MTGPTVVLVAAFDDAHHAHGSQRKRALERLGCQVTAVNLLQAGGKRLLFRRRGWQDELARALSGDPAPDLVLVIGSPRSEGNILNQMREGSPSTWVNWFPEGLGNHEHLAEEAAWYDHVFVVGTDVAEHLEPRLRRPIALLPLACDPSVYRPDPERGQLYRANVVFAGRATRRRERLLAQLVEFGLALWGPGWRQTALRDYCRGETVATEEFVRAYAGASVAVNIHHTTEETNGPQASCNQRLFEIAAIGVPQVVDARGDLGRWFEPGEELDVFGSVEEMKHQVAAILHHPPLGEVLGANARRRVLREHTYMHRLRRLLETTGFKHSRPGPPS